MSLYAVIREAGPAWSGGKGAFEQPGVNEHALLVGAERLSGAQTAAKPSPDRT